MANLVKEVTIRGKKLEIYVDSHGMFTVNMNGGPLDGDTDNELSAPDLKGLLEKADRQLKTTRKKFRIPFVRWSDGSGGWRHPEKPSLRRGVITGVHAGNGNILVEWEGRKGSEQDSSYSSNGRYLRMTTAQERKYLLLKDQIRKAKAEIEVMEKTLQIDIQKEIGDLRTDTD